MTTRLVMVSRRFWPLVGGAEDALAPLAVGLATRGLHVTLLTPRWQPDWPAEIDFRGVQVERLSPPRRTIGRYGRYLRAMRNWLVENRREIDAVYISKLQHEAYALIREAAPYHVPVVLRAETTGPEGDAHWQLDARGGRSIKNACSKAAAIIAPTPAIQRELVAAGFPRERIAFIPHGVPPRSVPDDDEQKLCRRDFFQAHPALAVPAGAPLAVYAGELSLEAGIDTLLNAWTQIIRRRPQARLWLVGEGSGRGEVSRQIELLDLVGRVVLPGAFDDLDEFLVAADAFVAPAVHSTPAFSLLQAMNRGLPVAVSDVPGHRDLIEQGRQGMLVPADDETAWAEALEKLFAAPQQARALGARASQHIAAHYSLDRCLDLHQNLFARLPRLIS